MKTLEFAIKDLLPAHLHDEQDGKAMAAAIETALRQFADAVALADALLTDANTMPEWALDELAWESAVPWYNFQADVETKRGWVRNAETIRACIGTRSALKLLLLGVFDQCRIEEYWQYGGALHHFRIIVQGNYTPEKARWARNAVRVVKPLRSVLESFVVAVQKQIIVTSEHQTTKLRYPICGWFLCGDEYSLALED
jgi:phage tail P2-like protein